MQKKSFSWGIIMLLLFLFFPAAIVMILIKMINEKFSYLKNGRTLLILSLIPISLAALYLLLGLTGNLDAADGYTVMGTAIMMVIVFGTPGLLSVCIALFYISKGKKYNRYISIIMPSKETFIDKIADAYPTTYEKAVKDLNAMVRDGYFPNSYVDCARRELIMPGCNIAYGSSPVLHPKDVTCKNCGAVNSFVPGRICTCEYCGSVLDGK